MTLTEGTSSGDSAGGGAGAGQAIPTPHRVLRASAGTGKTYSLAVTYLDLIHRGQPASGILATTFTRKAAGEILARILRRLAEAAADSAAAAALAKDLKAPGLDTHACRAMLIGLAGQLHRVAVSTIDAFLNRLAISFHHELGLPAQPRMVEEDAPMARAIRLQAIENTLTRSDPLVMLDLMQRLHHGEAGKSIVGSIERVVDQLLAVYLEAPEEALWTTLQPPAPVSSAAREQAMRTLQDQLETANKQLAKGITDALIMAGEQQWDKLLEKGLGKAMLKPEVLEGAEEPTYYRKPLPEPVAQAMAVLVRASRFELLNEVCGRTRATHELLGLFERIYRDLRDRYGVLLFSDLTYRLSPGEGEELPMSNLDIAWRLDQQIAHLMLDEFQDTSLAQWRVFEPLAEEITAVHDGQRSFFCVGDVKQAIYGWRGGCSELLETLADRLRLPASSRIRLTTSYRSAQPVLDVVNRVFSQLGANAGMPPDLLANAAHWSQAFDRHTAAFADREGYVELAASPDPEDSQVVARLLGECDDDDRPGAGSPDRRDRGKAQADDRRDADADAEQDESDDATASERAPASGPVAVHQAYVCQRVIELARDHPGATIGVLTPTNRLVAQYMERLRLAGLAVSGEGGVPVADDAAVEAILSAIWLADHPGDKAAAFHVLNSPLGEVVGLTGHLPEEVTAPARRMREMAATWGLRAVVQRFAQAVAASCEPRSARRLEQLIDVAHRFDQVAQPTGQPMSAFVAFARATSVEDPSADRIRVMTVHKAKGLEFDIVVMPELGRPIGRVSNDAAYVVRDSPTGPVTAVHRAANKAVRALSPELTQGHAQAVARRFQDDVSALYVAMTRARHMLLMIATPIRIGAKGKPNKRGVADGSVAAVLRAALAPAPVEDADVTPPPASGGPVFTHGKPDWAFPASSVSVALSQAPAAVLAGAVSLAPPDAASSRTRGMVSPSSLEGRRTVRAADRVTPGLDEPRLRGRAIHAMFECVTWLDRDGAPDDQALLAAARRASPLAVNAWLQDRLKAFHEMLSQPAVRDALSCPAGAEPPALWRERSFVVNLSQRTLNGVFDRVAVHAGPTGLVELIDFKTDQVTDDTIDDRAKHYAPQIRAYREALVKLLGRPASSIQASLLFVNCGLRRTVN